MFNYDHKLAMLSILLLALLHGGLYASFMPPWGLIDEEQHVHYIQYLAEQGTIPIVGQTYLSPEIVESVFETKRWEIFHWPAPQSQDPRNMGLEGHSYEGYQPPLFYVLFAPLYIALPDEMLIKVYCLRWAVVALSLLTVWMTYNLAVEWFPQQRLFPYLVCLLLIAIPERSISVSRINNDVLLEVVATAFVLICTLSMLKGLSIKRSQLLGLFLGLGVLTKISMAALVVLLAFVFWSNRHASNWWPCVLWTCGLAAVLTVPFAARNMWLYGDLVGFAGFRTLMETVGGFTAPQPTWQDFILATMDLFRHFWVVWWKGASVGDNVILSGFYLVLAVLSGFSLVGIARYILAQRQYEQCSRETCLIFAYALVIGGCAVAVLAGYFGGKVPVIQGRFFLPVVTPVTVLFSWGLWQHGQRGKAVLLASIGLLLIVNMLSLFGNLIPYFYYWSAIAANGALRPMPAGWQEAWILFYPRFLSDKPTAMRPILAGLLPLYTAALAFVAWVLRKELNVCWHNERAEHTKL